MNEDWNNKGKFFHNQRKYNEAIQCFDEAIKLDSKYKESWLNKGNSLLKLEKLDEALESFKKVLELDPTSKEALNKKAKIYKKKGNYDDALKFCDEALKIDPNYEVAKVNKERIKRTQNLSPNLYFERTLEELKKNEVTNLDLGDLSLGNNECKKLAQVLKMNYSLQELDLEENRIGNEGLRFLNETLKINNSLQILKLEDNFFDDESTLKEIETKLEKNQKAMTKIENSTISWNEIVLRKNELKILIINNCDLKDFPINFNELEELTVLDLKYNKLTEIPDVSKLNKLIILDLSRNTIKLEIEENAPYYICSLLSSKVPRSLKYLKLEANEGISKENINVIHFICANILNSPFFDSFLEALKLETKEKFASNLIDIILKSEWLESEMEGSSELFFWICFMNKIGMSIEKIIEKISNLKKLNILELNSNRLSIIPKESNISKIENLCTQLILMDNEFNEYPESILSLTKLKVLRLQNNNLSNIPQNISQLTNLKEISIECNVFHEFPIHLLKIPTLERIWIDNNSISSIPMNLKNLNLQRFSISQNNLNKLEGVLEWNQLQFLILNENNIKVIPKEIKNLKFLKKLYLNKNKIKSIPMEIRELTELTVLQIKDNLLEEIPVIIGELAKLTSINFSNNKITILPPTLYYLVKLNELNISGNPIVIPPIQISNNLNDLRNYWKNLLIGETKCNYLKLLLLGEENVGKTTLIKTLTAYNNSMLFASRNVGKEFSHKSLSSNGIGISAQPLILNVDKTYALPNNQLILNIWDFGGQEVYYSTLIFFLSPNSIYLIVWDMNKKSNEINRLIYWIQTIKSYIKNPMIILVGTHLDQIQKENKSNSKINEEEIYENISNKTGISKEYIIGVSCKNGRNYDKLIQKIKYLALNEEEKEDNKLPSNKSKNPQSMIGEIFPKIYFDLKKIIYEEGNRRIENNLPPILELKEFELISQKINIIGEELKRGLFFLHCLGFCLYFSKDKELNKYIILNSRWLADTMATLITTKSNFIKKGLMDHQCFKQVWKEPQYPSKIHSILFQLLQKFHILIPITHNIEGDIYSGKSVVPALLSNETKPINLLHNNWNEGRKIQFQRIYQFNSFLPSLIFNQFMATVFSLFGLKDAQYWRDGFLIKQENIKCLIELDLLNNSISISFVGKNFISLLKQIQLRLEMILNKWENLNIEIYVTCPSCSNSSKSNSNKCFKLKECFNCYSNQITFLVCKLSFNEVQIKKLIPELDLPEVKKLIEWNKIKIENKIAEGAFSVVYKGTYENSFVAIKKLIIENDSEYIREFLLEIGFLSFGKHNNLLQFIGIVLSPLSIIFPFAEYGSLFNLIQNKKYGIKQTENENFEEEINYSFELMLRIGLDISLGLNYLHSLNSPIIHCDLKSENVLIMNVDYKNTQCVCKLTDFQLSQFSVGSFIVNQNMNPRWAAPEVLEGKDQSILSDIYSFGVVLYEMLTKQIPYATEQNPEWKFIQKIQEAVLEGIKPIYSKESIENEFKTKIPNEIYEIMESCWDNLPKNRPSSKTIIKLFYSLLSNYWKEIANHIELPFSLNESTNSTNKVIEFKNEKSVQKIKEISRGTYGIISLCKIKELSEDKEYILKEIRIVVNEEKRHKLINYFSNELDLLKSFNSSPHPNIVQLIGYYMNVSDETKISIILEYCNGGSLEQYLNSKLNLYPSDNGIFSLIELRRLFKDILFGLKYLHENGYAHLNLKPDNILIKKENDTILNLCLSSFGCSRPQNNFKLDNELLGTFNYMAPEVVKVYMKKDEGEIEGYDGMKVDIWSLGLVLFRMLGELFPYDGPFKESLPFSSISNLDSYQPFPVIYLKCTQIEPINRPSVNQLLSLI